MGLHGSLDPVQVLLWPDVFVIVQYMNVVRNGPTHLTVGFLFLKLILAGCSSSYNSSLKNNGYFQLVPHHRCRHWPLYGLWKLAFNGHF